MPFLVLSEHGYQYLTTVLGRVPAPLWINPGILPAEEIRQLQDQGLEVTVLPRAVHPHSHSEIGQIVRTIQAKGQEPVWVEHCPSARPAPPAVRLPEEAPPKARRVVQEVGSQANAVSSRILHYMKRFAASDGPAMIVPYMSFGTSSKLALRGRVLKNKGYASPDIGASAWANMLEFFKQIGSDEVPGARLLARFGEVEQEIVTDGGGYFNTELIPRQSVSGAGWQDVELTLTHPAPRNRRPVQATARVLVPPPSARFGIISDIDDTVLWSNINNKLRMLVMLAVSNAHTRKPFKGVTAFYNALQRGIGGNECNPIFYVSSSPWHLYTPLVDFFEAQGIPLGPLLLKELGVKALFGSKRHHGHKLENIERILETYPHLPFILIGDSGQQDPEIYKEVVEKHPNRIRAIYIRNVNPDPARIEAIDQLIDEVHFTGTQLILVPDSEYAAMHAASEGLISAEGLSGIRSDKRDDERLTNPKI